MLDRYSIQKLADGRLAEAVKDAAQDRLTLQVAPRTTIGWAGPLLARRVAGRLLWAGLQLLVVQVRDATSRQDD